MLPLENRIIRCVAKGKFKNEYNLKKDKLFKVNYVTVSDEVEFDFNNDGSGVIFKVYERKNYLSRKAPRIKGAGFRGERLEQVIAANIDNLFVVSSISTPKFNNKAVDRLIVVGESSKIQTTLIINKADLSQDEELEAWAELYNEIGYRVIVTSVKTNEGLEEIRELAKGKKNILWGHSGVGKSSIINALYPSLNLKTGEISNFTQKGKHTTVTSLLSRVENDTYIIDTPGIREIDPYGLTKESLGHYFVEFLPYLEKCRFNTCTHHHEPDCGVIEAVENEEISPERYDSYINMLETVEEDMVY
ncbi:MAG: ribosome small subunit-dependent GTPase A [Bacteroidota bacterium]|nr:ribosome small subunit-dependent GTPase A [Bacteroidota bacterium]MDP4194711.1 ribosome small subunit-dependent GTPase A [Bacteroidota bacterium]